MRTILNAARTMLKVMRRTLKTMRTILNVMRMALDAMRAMPATVGPMLKLTRTMLNLSKSDVGSAGTALKFAGMTQNQENRVTMFGTVSDYMHLDANKPIWMRMKAAVDTMAEVDDGIILIGKKTGRQKTPTTGAAGAKGNVRHDCEAKILEIGDQLSSIAAAAKDAELAAQVEFSKAGLGKVSDDDLEAAGIRVATLAKDNKAALADHLVTDADVAELEQLTADFHKIKNQPRTVIAGRAGETATLPDLITAVTDLLRDRLDKQMTKFRLSHPEFYAGYLSARVVVDRGCSAPAKPPTPEATTPPPAK